MSQQIVPAILSYDPTDLHDKLKSVDGATDWIHVDAMDGNFVSNTSVDLSYIAATPHQSKIEVHLMVANPEQWIQRCKDAGASRVIFHYEATERHSDLLQKIDELGMQKGIALKSETPVEVIKDYINRVNVILIYSAPELGSSGQDFIPATLEKIAALRKMSSSVHIAVDGGVNEGNIKQISAAGADAFVIASGLFFYMDRRRAIEHFRHLIK